jgi:integrase
MTRLRVRGGGDQEPAEYFSLAEMAITCIFRRRSTITCSFVRQTKRRVRTGSTNPPSGPSIAGGGKNGHLRHSVPHCSMPTRFGCVRVGIRGQERLQARSINNYLAAVRAFCRWIHARYPLNWDPGREIPDERVDNKTYQRLPLSPTQVTTLIGSFDDSLIGRRDAAMTYLMAKTGLRAIQIQRADCGDLECLEIQVQQGADETREVSGAAVTRSQWILRTQGKGQKTKESFVNLMPEVYNRLQRYLEARGPVSPREPLFARHHDKLTAHLEQVRSKPGGAEGSTLAPNERLRLTTRAIQLRITEAMTRCGLRDAARPGEASPHESRRRGQRRVTPHSLRHTAATEAARMESPFKVQAMLNHKDIRTTQKYFHAIDRLEEGAEYAITRY